MPPKLELIFSIIIALNTKQYKFENGVMIKVLKKLIIAATNLLIYYLIFEIDYNNFFLVSKLIVLGIKFKIFDKIEFINNGSAKPGRQIRPGQCVPR